MSAKSRSRLLTLLNSVEFDCVLWVTLTYHENLIDKDKAYRDLQEWHRRVMRVSGKVGIIWRAERQKRGAIHFHVFVFNPPETCDEILLRNEWLSVVGSTGDWAAREYGVDIKYYDRLKRADSGILVSYAVKYAAKDGDPLGRAWGVLGKKHLIIPGDKFEVRPVVAQSLAEILLLRVGGKKVKIDGGGESYTLFMGDIGSNSTERIKSLCEEYGYKLVVAMG